MYQYYKPILNYRCDYSSNIIADKEILGINKPSVVDVISNAPFGVVVPIPTCPNVFKVMNNKNSVCLSFILFKVKCYKNQVNIHICYKKAKK